MVARAHLSIGKHSLNKIRETHNIKVYEKVFLFGCIAPDINFIYPCHNILATPKRFKKRIARMINIRNSVIRSFTLGVIMHYICDYFCIAHNNESYGARHTIYERIMSSHIKHNILLIDETLNLGDYWNEAITNYKISELAEKQELEDCWVKCQEVFALIQDMNNQYREFIDRLADTDWVRSIEQMQFDISWAVYIADRIYDVIYNPIEYISVKC